MMLDVLSGHTFGDSIDHLLERLSRSVGCAHLGKPSRALVRKNSSGES